MGVPDCTIRYNVKIDHTPIPTVTWIEVGEKFHEALNSLFHSIDETKLTRCKQCDAFINPELGRTSPSEHQDHEGTEDDPRAPGDHDDVCDVCDYS